MRGAEQFYEQIMHRMDLTKETEDEELQEIIRSVIEDAGRREYIPLNEKIRISRELFNAFRKLDILQELIEDDEITEIMVNGTDNIFYEKEGRLFRSERRFLSESRLDDVIQQIVGETNRYVNESSPIADARPQRRIPCQCSSETGSGQRPDPHHKEISGKRCHNGAPDIAGEPDGRSGAVLKKAGCARNIIFSSAEEQVRVRPHFSMRFRTLSPKVSGSSP